MQGQYIDLLDANRDAIKLRNATGLVYQPRLNNQGSYSLQINYSLSPYPGLSAITKISLVAPAAKDAPEPIAKPPPPPPVGVYFDRSAEPAPAQAAPVPAAAETSGQAPTPGAAGAEAGAATAPSSTATTGLVLNTVVK